MRSSYRAGRLYEQALRRAPAAIARVSPSRERQRSGHPRVATGVPDAVSVESLELDWGGPIGDRHHGETMASDTRQARVFPRGTAIRNHRQLSFVDVGNLHRSPKRLASSGSRPGIIAENICTEGLPELTAMPRMTRLLFPSGAAIMLGGANAPCTIAGGMVAQAYGSRAEAFPKAAIGRRGVTGWVERPGRSALAIHHRRAPGLGCYVMGKIR